MYIFIIPLMRCFISVDIDKKLVKKIVEMQKQLKGMDIDIKLVESENLHFTVKFLGDVNENEVDWVKKSLGVCLKGESEFKIMF